MNEKIIFDGELMDKATPIANSSNRGLRFGDGCFETMKLHAGKLLLEQLHFERLFAALGTLQFHLPSSFTPLMLREQVLRLAKTNQHHSFVRVRLSVFRGDGGLFERDNTPHYTIETTTLDTGTGQLNKEGLVVDIFKDARKACDNFSHIKSNNFLPYVMAAKWCMHQQLDEAIVLNTNNNIADGSISNVFIVKDGLIITPPLSEGCIAGVMRRHLLSLCKKEGLPIKEQPITTTDISLAAEVFLTNAVRGIRWVKQLGESHYSCKVSAILYERFLKEHA